MMASERVVVRVRPLNKRERELSSKVIISMKGNPISIHKPSPVHGEKPKDRWNIFSYDFSYDSTDSGSPAFASQERIFYNLRPDVLKAAFEGFNTCVLAYGQTASGKFYTMMGYTGDKGLIPQIFEGLVCEISQRGESDAASFCTEVSYLEICNERVQDHLKRTTLTVGEGLRVREHPLDGPYVETISPADVNYVEALSTLCYTIRAKNIVNPPTVNKDCHVKLIRELQEEVARLRRLLEEASQVSCRELSTSVKEKEKLHQNEEKVLALTKEWTGKWAGILQEEAVALRKAGSGVILDCQVPHLIGIDEDMLSTGIILYNLKEGKTLIGSGEVLCSLGIVPYGLGLAEHCVLENHAGTVTLIPQDFSVNGSVVTDPYILTQGAIMQVGRGSILQFNHLIEVAQLGERYQRGRRCASQLSLTDVKSSENLPKVMQQNPGQMDVLAETEYTVPRSSLTSSTIEGLMITDIPGTNSVPHTFKLDGDLSAKEIQKQKRVLCHKSGPELVSEWPGRKAGVASYKEVWSGDASFQQTTVLGQGNGCPGKPGGNANKIQVVAADCYNGRPGSGGTSLASVPHLQSSRGTSSTSVLPQNSSYSLLDENLPGSQEACFSPEETTIGEQYGDGEMDKSRGVEEISGVCVTETAAPTAQNAGLRSLINRITWIVQDAGRLLRSYPAVLQQVREEGIQPVGARWSRHVVSVVRKSSVLSVIKNSQVFSLVKGSFVFSLFKDSHIFSMVKEVPLIQHIQMEITQTLHPDEAGQVIQDKYINPDTTHLPSVTPTQTEQSLVNMSTEILPVKDPSEPEVTRASEDKYEPPENSGTLQNKINVQISSQILIEFPDSLLKLQTLPLLHLMDILQSIVSTSVHPSQKIVALYWLSVAKCSQPEPRPALLILAENGLYTLTTDSGLLVLFHQLPMLQLKEVQISLAGQSLCFKGTTEESILCVYTYSQNLTKELCWALFGILQPGDNRASQHPLLHEDLAKMSLCWKTCIPDLLLDAGLRVSCQFQKSLADLVYFLHCNMDQETVSLAEVQLLFYTGVRVCISTSAHTELLAQILLTDTHLGLVHEHVVFYRPPHSVPVVPCRPQFHDLTLRQRSEVRCVLVHDGGKRGAVRLDVILANVRGTGHPESPTKAATPPADASNSSLHAEVWKLTFSCSSEAACLINHLSNV